MGHSTTSAQLAALTDSSLHRADDDIIKIAVDDGEAFVHKHLLCERSQILKDEVEAAKEDPEDGWKYLVSWPDAYLCETGLRTYVWFLYGQPLFFEGEFTDKHLLRAEYRRILTVHDFATSKEDWEAADACMDVMRTIVTKYGKQLEHPFDGGQCTEMEFDSPRGRFLLDYVVHGDSGRTLEKWVAVFEHKDSDLEDVAGDFEEALAEKLVDEAKRKRAKQDPPDYMERCRYHLHVEKDLPCDLSKQ